MRSSVNLDSDDYSLDRIGINIVVYDSKEGKIIDAVCINGHETIR